MILFSIIILVIMIVTVGFLFSMRPKKEQRVPQEVLSLEELRKRVPAKTDMQEMVNSLEGLIPFLLQHRVSALPTRPVSGMTISSDTPILPSKAAIEDPGIGTALVLKWQFDKGLGEERTIGIWRSRKPGSLGERVADLSNNVREWVDWGTEHGVTFYYSIQGLTPSNLPDARGPQYLGQAFDRLPPDPPRHVLVSSSVSGKTLLLSWESPNEPDQNGVNIYRSEEASELGSRLAERVKGTRFEDKGVEKGKRYYYTVTSVDFAGNESFFVLKSKPVARENPFNPSEAPAAPEGG